MKRDYTAFPDDENGDVLWQMLEDGDDLSKPREVDFPVIFPTEDAALQFAVHLLRHAQKVSFSEYEEHDEMPWAGPGASGHGADAREHLGLRKPTGSACGGARRQKR